MNRCPIATLTVLILLPKPQDRYVMFVRWSEEDRSYVGYCPDLFPAGGVCHGATPVEAYAKLCEIVDDTVATAEQKGISLPLPGTCPMRERETIGSVSLRARPGE